MNPAGRCAEVDHDEPLDPGFSGGDGRLRGAIGAAGCAHPSAILRLGPREYWVAVWFRDEDVEPIDRIVQRGIKAASTAGVQPQKVSAEGTTL
jgi:hypothetical protein